MSDLLPDRYNIENLQRLLRDPTLLVEEANNLRRSAVRLGQNVGFGLREGEPFDILEEEWDNLLILDACRLDYYRDHTPFDEPVESRLSRGSATTEFLRENFHGVTCHDTVYVSSNPYVPTIEDGTFHAVVPLIDEWDDEWGTVHPEAVSDAAREAAERFPNKRLIVHYMQPHTPHLGETATQLREETPLQGWDQYHAVDGKSNINDGVSIWTLAKRGEITLDTLAQSYAETLQIVLDELQSVVPDLEGRTVVTADHGEMLGERLAPVGPREWAHTAGLLTEELRRVPWQVVDTGPRRQIESDPPVERRAMSDEQREQRLRALGYVA